MDELGRPVPGASVSAFWSANGLSWEQVKALRDDEPEAWTQNEGKMAPWGGPRVADADGRFSIPVPRRKNAFLAYDRERRRGAAIVFDPNHPEQPLEVRLQPLIRVFGTIERAGDGSPMTLWSSTYLKMPDEEYDPLNFRRMAVCGSYKGCFEFLVPPWT